MNRKVSIRPDAKVAELVKPAVVSITTVHIQEVPHAYREFYFGDPLEEFFEHYFGGDPRRRPRQKPRGRKRRFRSKGVGSGVIIDPKGLVLTKMRKR